MGNHLTKADFTNREIEILSLFAQGESAREIANKLFLSVYTVMTHRKNLLRKSQAPNTTALVVYCVRKGWL
jgi:DNA-binding NarL/FixJ family response regulator